MVAETCEMATTKTFRSGVYLLYLVSVYGGDLVIQLIYGWEFGLFAILQRERVGRFSGCRRTGHALPEANYSRNKSTDWARINTATNALFMLMPVSSVVNWIL